MLKNNDKFTTLDAYMAGFLTLKGHSPILIKQGQKIVFSFDAGEALDKTINEYQNGAMVDALHFTMAIKQLKSKIFSMKMENENEDKFNAPKYR